MKISVICWDKEWLNFSCDVAKPKQIGSCKHVIDRTNSALLKSQLLNSVEIHLNRQEIRATMKDGQQLMIDLSNSSFENLMNARTVPEMRARSIDLVSQFVYPKIFSDFTCEPFADLTNQTDHTPESSEIGQDEQKTLLSREDLEQKLIQLLHNPKDYKNDPSCGQILDLYNKLMKIGSDCKRLQAKHSAIRTKLQDVVRDKNLVDSVDSLKSELTSRYLALKDKLSEQQAVKNRLVELLSQLTLPIAET